MPRLSAILNTFQKINRTCAFECTDSEVIDETEMVKTDRELEPQKTVAKKKFSSPKPRIYQIAPTLVKLLIGSGSI